MYVERNTFSQNMYALIYSTYLPFHYASLSIK